jgi:zinc D-Ala-D-Ala dipeptidase
VGLTVAQRTNRELLIQAMEMEGFTVNPREWWHFDYVGWEEFKLCDMPFADISHTQAGEQYANIQHNL